MSKKPIRIVKKDELSRAAAIADAPPVVIPTEQDSARTMTKTVTGWIREFKQKGDAGAGKLLAVLEKPTRPNEA